MFETFGLDWTKRVVSNPTLLRPSDIQYGAANPERARVRLQWQAKSSVEDVVAALCEAAMSRLQAATGGR